MKIRTGFVSNSSSSSFTCDISGQTVSGWDFTLEDAWMVECVRGHVFNESYLNKNVMEQLKNSNDWRYEIPEKYCPLCQLEHISESDLVLYLLWKLNTNREKIRKEIYTKFCHNPENFYKLIHNRCS